MVTFIGSILWIAVFSYLMVWWATITGQILGIPDVVMGLTFLAAGLAAATSILFPLLSAKKITDGLEAGAWGRAWANCCLWNYILTQRKRHVCLVVGEVPSKNNIITADANKKFETGSLLLIVKS